jgi:hypothetical protein
MSVSVDLSECNSGSLSFISTLAYCSVQNNGIAMSECTELQSVCLAYHRHLLVNAERFFVRGFRCLRRTRLGMSGFRWCGR